MTYEAFARELQSSGLISDPWIRGEPRFAEEPRILDRKAWTSITECAESVAEIYDELVRICTIEPELLETFFGMSDTQRAMFVASAPAWHGIARADVFMTDRGPVCCELNCDTPSGEAEAVLLGARAKKNFPEHDDPSADLEDAFCALLGTLAPCKTAAIIYPTEMTEDLSMIALYRRWLEERGTRVILGSPFNITGNEENDVYLFGERCDLVIRHYKTDWWGEREPVWDDADRFQNEEPLESLFVLLRGALAGKCAVVNPFGSVLPQNKRSMAFMWEEIDRFSPSSQKAIRSYIPKTVRLEAARTRAREPWVLKSDYGCEGVEVIVGAEISDDDWNACILHASPQRWVLQERFTAPGENLGVYLVAGRACGAFMRLQDGITNDEARSAALLVKR